MAQTLFGDQTPTSPDGSDGVEYSLATRFTPAIAGTITHGRWYFPLSIPSDSQPVQVGIYRNSDQRLLGSTSFPLTALLGAWNQVAFLPPIPVEAGVGYSVVIWTFRRYVSTVGYPWPLFSGDLSTPEQAGRYAESPDGLTFPEASFNSACYFADVVFEPSQTGHVTASSTDQLGLSDAAVATVVRSRTVTDGLTLADGAVHHTTRLRAIADSLALTDTADRMAMTINRPAAETVTLADAVTARRQGAPIVVAESIALANTAVRAVGAGRRAGDALLLIATASSDVVDMPRLVPHDHRIEMTLPGYGPIEFTAGPGTVHG